MWKKFGKWLMENWPAIAQLVLTRKQQKEAERESEDREDR